MKDSPVKDSFQFSVFSFQLSWSRGGGARRGSLGEADLGFGIGTQFRCLGFI